MGSNPTPSAVWRAATPSRVADTGRWPVSVGASSGVGLAPSALQPTARLPGGAPANRRALPWIGLGLAYGSLSVAVWWHVWWGHPAGTVTCLCGDPAQSVWFIGWVAHALAHLQDPLHAPVAAYPGGVNLLSNQSSVLVGAAVAPVTWMFGPVAGLNTAMTAAPALDALAAVVLCRRFAGWWPAAVGGLVFGFSPLVVSELSFAHLADVVLVFLPLLVLCLHELLVRRRGSPVRWGLALAATVVAQFFVSTELLAATAVVLVVVGAAVAIAALAARARRGGRTPVPPPGPSDRTADGSPVPWRATIGGLVLAGAVAAGVLAWPLWYALDGPRHVSGAVWVGTADYGSAWDSFFRLPTATAGDVGFTHLGGYLGTPPPPVAYLGPGLLLVLGVGLAVGRRRPVMWTAAGALVVAAVLSLGAMLLPFSWYSAWWLPWRLASHLPVLQSIIPQRFMALGDLAAAVGAAIAVSSVAGHQRPPTRSPASGDGPTPHRRPVSGDRRTIPWREALAASLVVVAVVPMAAAYRLPLTTVTARVPAWFSSEARRLPAGSVLLTLPFPSGRVANAMAWQAMDGFGFSLAGAYAKLPGPTGTADYGGQPGTASWALSQLSEPTMGLPAPTPALATAIRSAIARWRVTEVVATGRQVGAAYPALYAVAFMTAVLGRPPVVQDGAWVWRVRPAEATSPLGVSEADLQACVDGARAGRTAPDAVPDCVMLTGLAAGR